MDAYLGSVLVFIGALVAIKGGTWDDTKPSGVRRVTLTGWVTFCISILGLMLALWSANASQIEKQQMAAKINKLNDHADEQQRRLKKANSDLNFVRLSLSRAENLAQISSSREQEANKRLRFMMGQDQYIKHNIASMRAANKKILDGIDLLMKEKSKKKR